MKNNIAFAAAVAALAVTATASAQTSERTLELTPSDTSIRLGIGLPLDDAVKNVSNSYIAFGFDYELNNSYFGNGGTFISGDIFTKTSKFDSNNFFPIAINQRFNTGNSVLGRRTYAFLGIGATFLNFTSSTVVASARAGLGADLGDALFFETALYISDRADNYRANAVALYIGYRF